MKSQSWSIFVFTYNEARNLNDVIDKVHKTLEAMPISHFEVIVVDDGSTDDSKQVLETCLDRHPNLRIIQHQTNLGIGEALKTGYRAARFENVCGVPGDGQFPVEALQNFDSIPDNTVIAFYRKKKSGYSPFRHFLSWANRIFNQTQKALRMKDVNWVKIYKTKEVQSISIENCSPLVESELCAKISANGGQIIEVPSVYLKRSHGKSKATSFKNLSLTVRDSIKSLRRSS